MSTSIQRDAGVQSFVSLMGLRAPASVMVSVLISFSVGVSSSHASGVSPITQSRSVNSAASSTGVEGTGSDSDTATSRGFEPFDASVVSVATPPFQPSLSVTASAAQESVIAAFAIRASGASSFNAQNCQSGCFGSSAAAASSFSVSFVVTQPISFEFDALLATIATPRFPWASSEVSFSGPGGTFLLAQVDDAAQPAMPSLSGLLIPGTYTITALTEAAEQFDIPDLSNSTFEVDFRVTSCVGDFAGDGAVDGADLGKLLAGWGSSGGPDGEADLDGNGVVNGADLGLLLSFWGTCPALGSNCCAPLAGVGCDTPPCQLCVCTLDPFCCDVEWDSICASEAGEECAASCLCG